MNKKYYIDGFQEENDVFLNTLLENRFFSLWKDGSDLEKRYNENHTSLELYITTECNLKCNYCYLYKNGDKLYPAELRNEENILSNLKKLFSYFLKNKLYPPEIELFSGEIWGTDFSYKIFDIILEYIDKGFVCKSIMIPSNMSFLISKEKESKVQEYLDIFKKKGTSCRFSASIEGQLLESKFRSFKSNKELRDDAFYDSLFKFCKKNSFGFHPMLSADSMKYWKENHEWWKTKLLQYDFDFGNALMYLEVRNDDWTDDAIKDYLSFLNYLIDDLRANFYQNDIEMMNDVLRVGNSYCSPVITNYNPLMLSVLSNRATCSIPFSLTVRLGDLAIVPCHRTSYPKFLYGHFDVKDNEIVGISSKNILLASVILTSNQKVTGLGCDSCDYADFCVRGCYGAQLEANKEINVPCKTVCKFFKARTQFLINKYTELGFLDILRYTDGLSDKFGQISYNPKIRNYLLKIDTILKNKKTDFVNFTEENKL